MEKKVYPATRRRLVKMLNWFKNKGQKIKVRYEYNNSLGWYQERCHKGVLESFTVTTEDCIFEKDFVIKMKFRDGSNWEETLSDQWEFVGLGELQMCNSGPYCYFDIHFTDTLITRNETMKFRTFEKNEACS